MGFFSKEELEFELKFEIGNKYLIEDLNNEIFFIRVIEFSKSKDYIHVEEQDDASKFWITSDTKILEKIN